MTIIKELFKNEINYCKRLFLKPKQNIKRYLFSIDMLLTIIILIIGCIYLSYWLKVDINSLTNETINKLQLIELGNKAFYSFIYKLFILITVWLFLVPTTITLLKSLILLKLKGYVIATRYLSKYLFNINNGTLSGNALMTVLLIIYLTIK